MSEKPRKRLVTWEQYLETAGKKGIAYSLAYVLLGSGLTLIFSSLVLLWAGFCLWNYKLWGVLSGSLGGLTAAVGIAVLRGAYALSVKARTIDRVELITRQNIGLLTPEESLVRSSDLPPSRQQAELLRAVPQGSETPPEDLLRASGTTRQEG